jgi:hypothetical protein
MAHGTFIFPHEPVYGWYLSVTAIGLNISWALHNVIAWMKNRPFLSRKVSIIYITTVVLCWPYWGLEIYANFTYFNNINKIFLTTRPMEPLFRLVIPFHPHALQNHHSKFIPSPNIISSQRSVVDLHNSQPILDNQARIQLRAMGTSYRQSQIRNNARLNVRLDHIHDR